MGWRVVHPDHTIREVHECIDIGSRTLADCEEGDTRLLYNNKYTGKVVLVGLTTTRLRSEALARGVM